MTSALSFLDLPGELRNQIYGVLLEDIVDRSRQTPCQREPPASVAHYLHFLLSCRQVSYELGARFQREYASRLTLTFDHPSKLSAFIKIMQRTPQSPLSKARFMLRYRAPMPHAKSDSMKSKTRTKSIESFLQTQPGFRAIWLEQPGLYETEPTGWNETDLLTMQRLGIPDYDFEPWNAADQGFVSSRGNHLHCAAPTVCMQYTQLSWPLLANQCQLTTFQWTTKTREACIVLEGRLSDLCIPKERTKI